MRDAATLDLGVTTAERNPESFGCETALCEGGRSLEDIRMTSSFEDIRMSSSFEDIQMTSQGVGDPTIEVRIALNL